MNPYERLANAIVLQAAEDYRKALKAVLLNSHNKEAQAEIRECEQFFRSSWYQTLTSLDGEMLISRLRQEVEV